MRPPQDQNIIWIPFLKGLGQDMDPTARPHDVPLALLDVEQEKLSKWGTRRGFHRLPKTVDFRPFGTPSTLDSARALFSTGGDDAELCLATDHFLCAYNEEAQLWNERGVISPFALRQVPAFQDDFTYDSADSVVHGRYILQAAIRKRQNDSGTTGASYTTALVARILSTDGHVILPYEVLGETSTDAEKFHSVKCVAHNGVLAVLAQKGLSAPNSIVGAVWNTQAPTTSGFVAGVSSIVSDAWAAGENRRIYDIIPWSTSKFLLSYIDNNGNQEITNEVLDLSLTTSPSTSFVLTANDPYTRIATAVEGVNSDRALVLAQTEASGGEPFTAGTMRLYSIRPEAGSIVYNVNVATFTNGLNNDENADDLGVVADTVNNRAICIWTRTYAGGSYTNVGTTVDSAIRDLDDGDAVGSLERSYNARVISKPWVRDGRAYAALATTLGIDIFDATNGAHFINFGIDPLVSPWDVNWVADLRAGETGDRPPHMVGLYDVGSAVNPVGNNAGRGKGNGNSVSNLPDYLNDPSGGTEGPEWRWLNEKSARQLNGQVENVAAMEMRADFAAPITWTRVHGGAVAIGGGVVSWYDGERVAELGHATAPLVYDTSESNTTPGQFTDDGSDYQYVPVWYWTDGRNFVHRSPPGPAGEQRVTNSSGNDTITVSARTTPATNRWNFPGVTCAWFRGDDDGNYKRVSQPVRVIPNLDTAFDTEDFVDYDTLERSDLLYTQSGELEAIAPEGARIVAMVNRRLKLGDMVRWFQIQFSKPPDAGAGGAYGLAPECNEVLSLQIERDREVTGMGALDDKWVIFTSSSIYLVAGEGPDDAGLNSDFSGLTLVNGNVGCIEARSVIEVPSTAGGFPGGLFFQSDAGIYLLDRGTGLHFIGAGVEDETDAFPVVTSASHDVKRQLVLFTVTNAAGDDGAILVYDYEASAWSKWVPQESGGATVVPVAGCMHKGQFYYADANGQVWQQQREEDATRYTFTVGSGNSSLSTGVVTLPSWLSLTRADSFCTTRTGASTVVSGIAANTARVYSEDGSTYGSLVEPSLSNLITAQNLSGWTASGTPVIASATLPTGSSENCSIQDDDAGAVERAARAATMAASTVYTLSAWAKVSAGTGGTLLCDHDIGSNVPRVASSASDTDWTYKSNTDTTPGGISSTNVVAYATSTTDVAETGTCLWGLMQVEARAYATSFHTSTRPAESLLCAYEVFSPGGWFKLTLAYAPQYASDEATADHHLFYIDADNRCFWDQSAGEFVLRLGGSNVVTTSSSPTWSQGQSLTVTMWSRPDGCGITIAGATSGDGSTTAAAQSKLRPLPKVDNVVLFGGASGAEEGVVWSTVTVEPHPVYFDDGDEWIDATIETADLFGGQAGGWQRVQRFVPVVERYETTGGTVGLDVTVTTDGIAGDSKQFSATMVDDWEGQKVPVEIRPDRAKCQSARLKLVATEGASAESGRGLAFSGVRVHVRPRATPARLGLDGGNQRS